MKTVLYVTDSIGLIAVSRALWVLAMSLTYDLSAHPGGDCIRGVRRWTRFSLVGTRTAGLAAASHLVLDSRLFSELARTAAALLSMIARPANDTPFTSQFSKFIGSQMKLLRGGFPSSVP